MSHIKMRRIICGFSSTPPSEGVEPNHAVVDSYGRLYAYLDGSVDTTNGALTIEENEHKEIHDGDHYYIDDVIDLAINAVYDMQFTTPNTARWSHFKFYLSCEAETEWYIYEGVTISTAGTAVTPRNNNRNVADNSVNTVAGIENSSVANANADTAVAGATELAHGIVGAGRSGGLETREKEIVLKQNTNYCFRAIANAAGYTNFYVSYYEHTND